VQQDERQDETGENAIENASRLFKAAEINYTISEKQCLSMLFAYEKFRYYLFGRKFTPENLLQKTDSLTSSL